MITLAARDPCDVSDLLGYAAAGFQPDPDLYADEWAEQRRILTSDDSKATGLWTFDPVPWARDIMRALSPQVRIPRVIWKSSSQTAKSAVGLNFIGCAMDISPGPILVVQPTQSTARKFSRQRLKPMIQACPTLKEKVHEGKGRDGGNSTFEKEFPGGALFVGWAGSANELASMPIRYIMGDEVSKWPRDLDKQGDALGQTEQRGQNFGDQKKIFVPSTPTTEGECTVTEEFNAGDQRKIEVPCPHCGGGREDGGYQEIVWEQVQWEKEVVDGKKIHRPETAHYVCVFCGSLWDDRERLAAVQKYRWVAHNWNGERRVLTFEDAMVAPNGTASFESWCLYTPWETHASLAREFLKVRTDPGKLKRFTNLKLGRAWKENATELDADELRDRRKNYGGKVPLGAAKLTMGVDVQGDRLELAVWAWGPEDRRWCVMHLRIAGDPDRDEVWERLEAIRTRPWEHEGGATLRIEATCIDARHKKEAVFKYVRPRRGRGVYAVHGYDSRAKEILSMPKKPNRFGVKPVTIATHNLKDSILPALARGGDGPGSVGFCSQDPKADGMDANFFQQFKAEVRVREKSAKGRWSWTWKALSDRAEAIDTFVYAYAGLLLLTPAVYDSLDTWHRRILAEGGRVREEQARKDAEEAPPPPPRQAKRPRGGSWATMGGALGGGGRW